MNELNYSIFYKAKFMLESTVEDADMLWEFILCIHQWQTRKWNQRGKIILESKYTAWSRLKNGGRLFSANGSERPVYIESEYFSPQNNPTQQFWSCKIAEKIRKETGYCERDWVTEIGFQQIAPQKAEFSCVITYGDMPEFIGRYQETPEPSLPKLINILIESKTFKCYTGIDDIVNAPTELNVGDFPAFREALINPSRTIPYIYISPRKTDPESENTELMVSPVDLSKAVCGNARVFFSESMDFTQEMRYMFGLKEFCCYGGSIRVYKPGMNDSDVADACRHRILLPAFIEEVGTAEIIRIYRRALAQNVNYYETYFGMKNCQDMRNDELRQKKLDEIRAKHAQEIGNIQDEKFEEAIEFEEKYLQAEKRVHELESEKNEWSAKKYGYEAQIEGMKTMVVRASGLDEVVQSRMKISQYPQTKEAIVDYFASMFADRIDFSDSAVKSLKDCTLASKDLWRTFYSLATIMCDIMRSDNSTDPYKEFRNQTGVDAKRSEGMMTRQDPQLMKQFQVNYKGRMLDIEPHITFADEEQSIHFCFDKETERIIVGHCGEHLRIYSTRKHR